MRILITGGAGFIGSHVTRHMVAHGHQVCVATRNTYATKWKALADILPQIDVLIGDLAEPYFAEVCAGWRPEWVLHMAAETHVDRAIEDPACFIRSNTLATTMLLQALWGCPLPKKIIIYSTDEVFGSTPPGQAFDEETPYNPSNAYSASKVGIEAIAHSFWVTHQMPVVIVRPCNTYGPGQHPEKVIPKFVQQLLSQQPITLYNDGNGSRDWLHVADHAQAIAVLLDHGIPGRSYNLGANEEHTDREIAERSIQTLHCRVKSPLPCRVTSVPGRPGHDRRYMMDNARICALGWKPERPFTAGLHETVVWNIAHQDWWDTDSLRIPEVAHA